MIKNLTCTECPKGCALTVEVEDGKVAKVSGNLCAKGDIYARSEIENPLRILTSSVLAQGLNLKMVPVRTDKGIPRKKIFEAMAEVKKIKLKRAVQVDDVIVGNFMGLGVNLVATREAF
ncbi:MAG: DUF1667 domain-containing protein [Candidatus Omnitrophota bacterium]